MKPVAKMSVPRVFGMPHRTHFLIWKYSTKTQSARCYDTSIDKCYEMNEQEKKIIQRKKSWDQEWCFHVPC